MKNLAAVALGQKRAAKLEKRLGKKGMREHMRNVALMRHGKLDKLPAQICSVLSTLTTSARVRK